MALKSGDPYTPGEKLTVSFPTTYGTHTHVCFLYTYKYVDGPLATLIFRCDVKK